MDRRHENSIISEITFYYKLYNTEEFITPENIDSEENVSNNVELIPEKIIFRLMKEITEMLKQ